MDLDHKDASYVGMVGLNTSIEMFDGHLNVSHGERTMSDEDVKVCLVLLKIALNDQMKINQSLISRIKELENWKSKLRFWKK